MNTDSRLSAMLHALLHLADTNKPLTSEALAACMDSNAAVVRRSMAGLREMGVVRSNKGHGGGWQLDRDLDRVTLRDIHRALGSPRLFAIGNKTANPACLVEQAVNAALDDALHRANALLLERFGGITLAALSADFHRRLAEHASKESGHAA